MPELPEVETVRRGLEHLAPPGTRIVSLVLHRRDLRTPVPRTLRRRVVGQSIRGYRRWGKYLLWDLSDTVLLSHLGMSGTWRVVTAGDDRPHDHLVLRLDDGRCLAYHDPRRFGLVDVIDPGGERHHQSLGELGPDALDQTGLTLPYLVGRLQGRRAPIKNLLLDQRLIAGLGNIYACEALFRAGLRPLRAAGKIGRTRLDRLLVAIRQILTEAIAAGGSTLRDYRQASGEDGWFQHSFRVYGREGKTCTVCGRQLRSDRIAGRATVWCPGCQR